ncbi:MAG: LD-carboxypeptidase [Pseudomonadota bacterium]
MRPQKLKPGDRIRFVSPASTPTRAHVDECRRLLESWGLIVEIAPHAFDEFGYLAGDDAVRLADFNDALRDPDVRAIMATTGGKGAYRIADRLDFDAARADPKLLIGFSEITVLHLALYRHCQIAGLHGASWTEQFSRTSTASLHAAMFSIDKIVVLSDPSESTHALTTAGTARGILLGGNQDMIAAAAGWGLPSFDGAILLLEAAGHGLGTLDRQLTMLRRGGHLSGLAGVAVGQYTNCGPDPHGTNSSIPGMHTHLDVLRDHFDVLGVPVLGGLPIGHGSDPVAVPLGTACVLDADAGTLTVDSAVI